MSKGEWVSLCNTDYFGLLPESYWYELIFCEDTPLVNKPGPEFPEMEITVRGHRHIKINSPLVSEVKLATRAISDYVNNNPDTDKPESDEESDTDTLDLEYDIEECESQSLCSKFNFFSSYL